MDRRTKIVVLMLGIGVPRRHAALVDINLPDGSGFDVMQEITRHWPHCAVVVVTGEDSIDNAVRAAHAGAMDFIEKPFNDELLLESIRSALAFDQRQRTIQSQRAEIAARLAQLTPREHEVMEMVTEGRSNKEIAIDLGVSAKTVEAHRARVMEKMQAGSLAEP